MAVEGSDCITGKLQYADNEAAQEAARAARARGWATLYSYHCAFCRCWHLGNRRGGDSKSRRGRE